MIFIKELRDQVFFNIASAQLTNLNYKGAIKNYSKAILYDNNDDIAFLNRGNAKFKINNYLGSVEDFNKSISINNKSFITLIIME